MDAKDFSRAGGSAERPPRPSGDARAQEVSFGSDIVHLGTKSISIELQKPSTSRRLFFLPLIQFAAEEFVALAGRDDADPPLIASKEGKVAGISGDDELGSSGDSHFSKRDIIRVRSRIQISPDWARHNMDA